MMNEKITARVEDYLEIIYQQLEVSQKIKAVDISKKLGISRASVTEALQKLAQRGYIVYEKNSPIELTEIGEKIAKEVILKHNILCDFFTDVLKVEKEEAEINACRIEHVITEKAFEKIKNMVEFLQ